MTNQNQNPLPLLPDPLEDRPVQLPPTASPQVQPKTADQPNPIKPHRNYWRIGLISVGAVVVLLAILFGPRLAELLNLRGSKAAISGFTLTETIDGIPISTSHTFDGPQTIFEHTTLVDGKLYLVNPME